jgi:hypothetical protein
MKHLFCGTRNANETMFLDERTLYPRLPSASGETLSCSNKSKRVQDSCVLLQDTSHQTAVPRLPIVPGTSPGSNTHLSQASQDTSDTESHYADEYIDSDPSSPPKRTTSIDAAIQCSPSGDHRPHNHSITPRSTSSDTAESANSPHTPLFQRYAQSRELERYQSPVEQGDQDDTTPSDTSESQFRAADFPVAQHDPNNSAHILKLLKRDVGGGATCLWQRGGDECGFSSQIDLVKRHIKRVHYRLR